MAKSEMLLAAVFLSFCSTNLITVNAQHVSTQPTHSSSKVGSCNSNYCYDDDDSDFWLFWLFIIVAALLTSICCGYCCRLRFAHRRRRLLILPGERPHAVTQYGTEVVAPVIITRHPGYNYNPYLNPQGYPQPGLPTYTPIAENKGEPPPYNAYQ